MEINLNTIGDIEGTYLYVIEKHTGQKRKYSNTPYMIHPEMVTCMVATYTDDKEILQAALLHDTVEDTDATLDEIGDLFGGRVRDLVDELTNDKSQIDLVGKKVYMSNVFNTISNDALLIKLVDRLHNVLGLLENKDIPCTFVKWYNKETMYILDNMNRKLTSQHEELLTVLRSVVGFIDLQSIHNNTQ